MFLPTVATYNHFRILLHRTHVTLELLKNSMIQINKTASNVHFNGAEMDREINFSTTLLTKGTVHYSSLHNRMSKILCLNADLCSN